MIQSLDCTACHSEYKKSIAPAFYQVSVTYNGDKTALERLTKKVISGGKGVWGEVPMAPHPALSTEDAASIVKEHSEPFPNPKPKVKSLPACGTHANG